MFMRKNLHGSAVSLAVMMAVSAGMCLVRAEEKDVWKDDASGLTWAAKDNGSSVSPNQGNEYCSGLRAGGYSDWRLPTIDELDAVYDSKQSKQYRIKGAVELSDPCVLSGSTNPSGEVWTFCFNSGSRNLGGGSGCSTSAHALCVRGPAK